VARLRHLLLEPPRTGFHVVVGLLGLLMLWAGTLPGLAVVSIDPRHAVAACWLFPFLALNHLYWGGPLGLTVGVLAGLVVVAIALATTRSTDPGSGRGLTT
jgi:hypothetical protein